MSRSTPPGPDGVPVLGSLLDYVRDPLEFFTRCGTEYGDVVRTNFANYDVFVLSHPDHVEHVLVENADNYWKGQFQTDMFENLLGDGLFVSDGDLWKRQRRLIQPAFYPQRIESYTDFMTDATADTVDEWEDGEIRDVHADMMELTIEVLGNALFDMDLRDDVGVVGDSMTAIVERFEPNSRIPAQIPDWVPTRRNRRYLRAIRALEGVIEEVVEERRATGTDGDDLLSSLLRAGEDGEGMSDEQLRDEMMTFILAGHETTALTLTYALYLLATHPEHMTRLADEVDDVLGDDPPTADDRSSLEFTDRVIEESMRLYPPIFTLQREPHEDDEIAGYRVPAGSIVVLPQWIVHRDDRWFDDPGAFRPDRWNDGLEASRPDGAYFPFGLGPRHCIGKRFAMTEATLVLATLAQRVRFENVPDTSLDLGVQLTLRPTDPVQLRVRKR